MRFHAASVAVVLIVLVGCRAPAAELEPPAAEPKPPAADGEAARMVSPEIAAAFGVTTMVRASVRLQPGDDGSKSPESGYELAIEAVEGKALPKVRMVDAEPFATEVTEQLAGATAGVAHDVVGYEIVEMTGLPGLGRYQHLIAFEVPAMESFSIRRRFVVLGLRPAPSAK